MMTLNTRIRKLAILWDGTWKNYKNNMARRDVQDGGKNNRENCKIGDSLISDSQSECSGSLESRRWLVGCVGNNLIVGFPFVRWYNIVCDLIN